MELSTEAQVKALLVAVSLHKIDYGMVGLSGWRPETDEQRVAMLGTAESKAAAAAMEVR